MHSSAPSKSTARGLLALRVGSRALGLAVALLLCGGSVEAQDWGDDSSEDWSAPAPAASTSSSTRSSSFGSSLANAAAGWSVRGGVGFTADPDTFLMNFEVPYAFNEWISAGPMLQVGLEDHWTIVAPTANLTLSIPDLPGRTFDRVRPFFLAGLGLAVIEKDRGRNDGDGVGFQLGFGSGVEYQVSEKVFVGTQMMFNFLPKDVKGEGFYYAWQVAGIRFGF